MPEAAPGNCYVFPAGNEKTVGQSVANQLKELLLNGSVRFGQVGLDLQPQFINRKGSGAARDHTTYITAKVRFPDDLPGGGPEVLVAGIRANGKREYWGDNQFIQNITISLDCDANQFLPGAMTAGVDPHTVSDVLGDYVLDILSNEDLMDAWGFTDTDVNTEPPPNMQNKEGLPFDFHYPITVSCDVYISRV